MFPMTPWVKRLLIANVVMFVVAQPGTVLFRELWLFPLQVMAQPWRVYQAVTYMFLHGGIGHILFNMIALFFFGPRLEQRLGGRDFLWLYFLSGLGGAALSFVFAARAPVVGASGAVYGIILGFALFWPRERIYIWAILPVEAWLLATIMVVGSLYFGLSGSQGGTAHFAHLGGLAFGYGFIKWRDWRRGSAKRAFKRKLDEATGSGGGGVVSDRAALKRWEAIDLEDLHELNREEVVSLLEKARDSGTGSLSRSERQFLDRMATSTGL